MEHLLNDHEDHPNKHENSHKLYDDYSRAEFLDFLVGQDFFFPKFILKRLPYVLH